MKNTLKVLVAGAVAVIAVAVWASDPSPLASGVFPTYPKQTWPLANGTIGAQIGADGGLSYIKGLQYVWPAAHAAGVLTDNGSGTLTWGTAIATASTATWALHIDGSAVSNAVPTATWALHVAGSAVSNAVPTADLATWASHVNGSAISNTVPWASIPGLTYTLTVVTNGTDTATLHFTNGVLGAVTAP